MIAALGQALDDQAVATGCCSTSRFPTHYFSTGRPFPTHAVMSPSRCDSRV